MIAAILAQGGIMAAWSVRLAVAAILLEAAHHALTDRQDFAAILGAYRILPERAAGAAALGLPLLEIAASLGLMVPRLVHPGTALALLLLLLFTAAMSVNLARGRLDIDCGCGGDSQRISVSLLVRNLVLVAALALTLAVPVRLHFGAAVTVGVAGFGVFLTGLYFATNQLIANAQAFGAGRGVAA